MFSYFGFLLSWLLPPRVYKSYINEPDFLFLDLGCFLFYSLCVAAFMLGVLYVDRIFKARWSPKRQIGTKISPVSFILFPLVIGTIFTVTSCFLLIRKNPLLVLLLSSQSGAELKGANAIEGTGLLGMSGFLLMGIVWWATWRLDQLRIDGWKALLPKIALCLATAATLIAATLKLGRTELMPIVAGLATLYLLKKITNNELKLASFVRFSGIAVVVVLILFFAFSLMRGSAGDDLVSGLVGYTASSYNRLSAVVEGRFRYPYGGRGVYLCGFLAHNNTFNKIVPVSRMLNWPDFLELWSSEFSAPQRAGLEPSLIWSGAFGYIFSDLGWFSPFFLFIYGLMYGGVWRSVKRNSPLGIVLYPWFAFCVLFWFGTNLLLDNKVVFLVLLALALTVYEYLFVKRTGATSSPREAN